VTVETRVLLPRVGWLSPCGGGELAHPWLNWGVSSGPKWVQGGWGTSRLHSPRAEGLGGCVVRPVGVSPFPAVSDFQMVRPEASTAEPGPEKVIMEDSAEW
jgi:hypothetical protein